MTDFESSEYCGAKIRTYSYEGDRQFGVDVFYGDHEYHRDGFPTRSQALIHGQECVDSLPKPKPEKIHQAWNQDAMTKYAATAYARL